MGLFIFILGLSVGSFLNVCIYRIPQHESIVVGRSHCPHCSHVLQWYELIPVVSFIAQRGRCRNCHEKISIQYPLVELSIGIIVWMGYELLVKGIH